MYFHVLQKKYPVDFDDKLKIGDVRYDNMTYVNKHNFEIHEPKVCMNRTLVLSLKW